MMRLFILSFLYAGCYCSPSKGQAPPLLLMPESGPPLLLTQPEEAPPLLLSEPESAPPLLISEPETAPPMLILPPEPVPPLLLPGGESEPTVLTPEVPEYQESFVNNQVPLAEGGELLAEITPP